MFLNELITVSREKVTLGAIELQISLSFDLISYNYCEKVSRLIFYFRFCDQFHHR